MHANAQRLLSRGFHQPWTPSEDVLNQMRHLRANYGDKFADSLLTVPGSASYLPALTPTSPNWPAAVTNLVRVSFGGLIADIWTQLLVTKRDSKEKPLYLFWDDEVPKPSRLTSLAWLLTCEAWPMPTHVTDGTLPDFPVQPFMIPQSTPYGYTGASPLEYAAGPNRSVAGKSMIGLFAESMHRGDRENMALCEPHLTIYRPSVQITTALGFHVARDFEERYHRAGQWASRSHSRLYDQGLASWEIAESEAHLTALKHLRNEVMSRVLTAPGIPTHPNSLHQAAGMSIRNWSENGLTLDADQKGDPEIQWTPDGNSIKLEHGTTLARVPPIAPRVWFGFSKLGSYWDEQALVTRDSASVRWVDSYIAHRSTAIKMLFDPESIDIPAMLDQAASARAKLLERAGRLKKTTATVNNGFAQAFSAFMKKED